MGKNNLKILALAIVLTTTASAMVMSASAFDAESYDGTIDLYGYKITMGLIEPSQVSSVEWDFGDGSETVTVQITSDNPVGSVQHTYATKGDYVVTATMRNQYTDSDTGELKDGETKLTYLYHIYGYPIVTFDSNGGSPIDSIEGTSSHYVPAKPSDPVKAGFEFKGWFKDEGCTQEFDWTSEVTKHTTLYAGWEAIAVPEYTSVLKYDANGGTNAPVDDMFTGTSADAHVFTVTSSVPTRDGYKFVGWADTSDASEAIYGAGDGISVDCDGTMTIYAVWSKILTVVVDAPSSVIIGTTVSVHFTVNDMCRDGNVSVILTEGRSENSLLNPDSDGYGYVFTFMPVKTGKLVLTISAVNEGCVTATQIVEIQILSNGVTVPPSAEGIEAEVKE